MFEDIKMPEKIASCKMCPGDKETNSELVIMIIYLERVNCIQKRCGFGRNCYPANIYLFKVNNRNTRKRCKTCSKFTIKTPERCR